MRSKRSHDPSCRDFQPLSADPANSDDFISLFIHVVSHLYDLHGMHGNNEVFRLETPILALNGSSGKGKNAQQDENLVFGSCHPVVLEVLRNKKLVGQSRRYFFHAWTLGSNPRTALL